MVRMARCRAVLQEQGAEGFWATLFTCYAHLPPRAMKNNSPEADKYRDRSPGGERDGPQIEICGRMAHDEVY